MAFVKLWGTGFEQGSVELVAEGLRTGAVMSTSDPHTGTYELQLGYARKKFRVSLVTLRTTLYLAVWVRHSSDDTLARIGFLDTNDDSIELRFDRAVYNLYVNDSKIDDGTINVSYDEWHLVEFYVSIHPSAGTAQSRIDGIGDIDFTGDTAPSAATHIKYVSLIGSSAGLEEVFFDDFSFGHNGWPGDIRYDLISVTADEGTNEWDPSVGGGHYALVDEVPPDDADYLSTDTDDEDEIFGCADWDGNGKEALDLTVWARMIKDEAAAHQGKLLIKEGVNAVTSDALDLLTSYSYIYKIFATAPDGTEWNDAHLDAVNIGIRSIIV